MYTQEFLKYQRVFVQHFKDLLAQSSKSTYDQ